jgi:hypothetical protein
MQRRTRQVPDKTRQESEWRGHGKVFEYSIIPVKLSSGAEPGKQLEECALWQIKNMAKNNSIVAIYPSHTAAEAAIKELQQGGFDMKKLSIVGSDIHKDEHVVGYYNTGDRMKYWGKLGAFWGWTSGLLFDSAFFLIPGIGPLIVAGPLVGGLVGALEGAVAVGGLSAIGAGLYSLGIPKDSILKYETALKTDKFVLIAHGSIDEINRAKEILHRIDSGALEHHQ